MGKIIFWLALVFAVMLLWRIAGSKSRLVFKDKKPSDKPPAVEVMHACEQCGAMSPRSACVEHEGHLFCGTEHRNVWVAAHAGR
jgi:hypothetical protein